ncbi:MAG: hypothetical protein WC356_03470 [Candidatus Micrarchaeia archaeon]|jgi:hypothetical protein
MKKLLYTLLILTLITILTALNAHAYTLEAIISDEIEGMLDSEIVIFASELNISNGRQEHGNGERGIFGKLVHAGTVLSMPDRLRFAESARAEVTRLLLGPWTVPGNTELKLVRRNGLALDLNTGKWKPYSGQAIAARHVTEYFGGLRVSLLAIDGGLTVLRVR